MLAHGSDIYSGGDAFGVPTTTTVQKVDQTKVPNQPLPANPLVAVAGLVVAIALWHKFHKGSR